jgi:hypothetical protein
MIGVEDDSRRRAVEQALSGLAIPRETVVIEVTGEIRPLLLWQQGAVCVSITVVRPRFRRVAKHQYNNAMQNMLPRRPVTCNTYFKCYNDWYMKEDQRLYRERIVADPMRPV